MPSLSSEVSPKPLILSPKQIRSYQESNRRINIWQGAVRSGKTFISLLRFLAELAEGPDGEYCIITRTTASFRRNVMPQIMHAIGADAQHYTGRNELHIWGKNVHIIGADDERAETKVRGPTFMGAYVDEATIIPESVFKMLVSRCAMGGAKIFATTNPDSPFHWLKVDYLTNNPDVATWHFTLDDNPELKDDEKMYLRRQYQGLWYRRFIEGQWVQAEGAVYDFFDTSIHVIPHCPQMPEYYVVGVDYGTTNPCSFVMIGVNRNGYPNMWVEKEYYFDSRIKQRQKTDSEYADDLKKFIAHCPVRAIYIDPSAASFKLELRNQGVQNLMDAKNDVIDGIRFVGDLLNNGTLKITAKCPNVIKEFQSYVWDEKSLKTGVDKPSKHNDHSMDALRYAAYTHFYNKTTGKIDWGKLHREFMGGEPELPRFFSDPVDPFAF